MTDKDELRSNLSAYPLHLAIVNDDISSVKSSLTLSAINLTVECGKAEHSPLTLAIVCRHYEIVQYLLEKNAVVDGRVRELVGNCVDRRLVGLFARRNAAEFARLCYIAASNENEKVLATFLNAHAPHSVENEDWRVPAHAAACNVNDKVIQLLIRARADCTAVDCDGLTPAHLAARNCNARVLERLLNGAIVNVDDKDKSGRTLCHFAASNSNEAVMALLIAAKADVHLPDDNGRSPLFLAASNENEKIFEMLLAAGAIVSFDACDDRRSTLLHAAASNRNAAILEKLIAMGFDVSARDIIGATPCHYAAASGGVACLQTLLAAGATLDGDTIFAAAKNKCAQVLALVLSRGGSVSARDRVGRTPCHIAAAHVREKSVVMLLNAGANVNAVDHRGVSVLHSAVRHNIDHCDFDDDDPERSRRAVVRLLLQRGADPKLLDNDGHAPVHIAVASAMVVLFAHGVDVDAVTAGGLTRIQMISKSFAFLHVDELATLLAARVDLRFRESNRLGADELMSDDVEIEEKFRNARACVPMQEWLLFRLRAHQVCVGLESLQLPALVTCEILSFMFGPRTSTVVFHRMWDVATLVKHFTRHTPAPAQLCQR